MIKYDLSKKPDMLIVMGTSLSIQSLRDMVKGFAKAVKNRGGVCVLVNKTEVSSMVAFRSVFDYHIKEEVDRWVQAIVAYWRDINPSDWESSPAHPNLMKYYTLLDQPVVITQQ